MIIEYALAHWQINLPVRPLLFLDEFEKEVCWFQKSTVEWRYALEEQDELNNINICIKLAFAKFATALITKIHNLQKIRVFV